MELHYALNGLKTKRLLVNHESQSCGKNIVDNDNHVKVEIPTAMREKKTIKWQQILQIRVYLILTSNISKLPMNVG